MLLASIKQAPAPGRPPNVNAMLKNSNFTPTSASKADQNYAEDDDEDTRDMTGRIRTAAGVEVRAYAHIHTYLIITSLCCNSHLDEIRILNADYL